MGDNPMAAIVSADQLIINGGQFIQNITAYSPNPDLSVYHTPIDILTAAVAYSAIHNSADNVDAPRCHKDTRITVLEKTMDWIMQRDQETRDKYVMWLTGAAGAGKSAITNNVVDLCIQEGLPVMTFVFKRSDGSRNGDKKLIATLAYQLCCTVPAAKKVILSAIENDPLIFNKHLEHQFELLIAQPLQVGAMSRNYERSLLVIDELDECIDSRKQVQILNMARNATRKFHLPIFFLIASRLEHEIRSVCHSHNMMDILWYLVLNDEYQPSQDIQKFICDVFMEIKQDHPFKDQIPLTWPADAEVDQVVRKSSGHFIYAATVVRYVKSLRHLPHQRLRSAIELTPPMGDLPFSELDSLYRSILSSVERNQRQKVLSVIELCMTSSEFARLPISSIEPIFDFNHGEIGLLFCDLGSLISLSSGYVEFLHAPLPDFFLDRSRSKKYYLDSRIYKPIVFSKIVYAMRPVLGYDTVPLQTLLRLWRVYHKDVLLSNELIDAICSFPFQDFLPILMSPNNNGVSWPMPVEFFLLPFLKFLRRIEQEHNQFSYIRYRHEEALDGYLLSCMSTYNAEKDHQSITYLSILCNAGNDPFVPITQVKSSPFSDRPLDRNDDILESALFRSGVQVERDWMNRALDQISTEELVPMRCIAICVAEPPFHLVPDYHPGDVDDKYRHYVVKFLLDPMRSQRYFIGPDAYAKASIWCIQKLRSWGWYCEKEIDEIEVYSHTYHGVREKKWRTRIADESSLHTTFILSGYVLYFLPRASTSAQLMDLCLETIGLDFERMSIPMPLRYRLVKDCMMEYIGKMED